jgi:single-strand DNA-binding protein
MTDLNTVTIIGRLTRDAEQPSAERAPLRFSIAVNRSKKQGDQFVDEANYFDIEYWHRSILPHLTKGKQVAITGELRQDRWTDKDGATRSKVVISARDIQLLGGSKSGHGEAQEGPGKESSQGGRERPAVPSGARGGGNQEDDGFGDEIPF